MNNMFGRAGAAARTIEAARTMTRSAKLSRQSERMSNDG
jgi:hypothetical protein